MLTNDGATIMVWLRRHAWWALLAPKRAALRIQAEKMLKQQRQLHRKLARAWEKGQPLFD